MLTRTVENAQKKVEQQNFLIRKRVLEYDDVMNEQRRVIYKYRREILEGRDMSDVGARGARRRGGEAWSRSTRPATCSRTGTWRGLQAQLRAAMAARRRPRRARRRRSGDREELIAALQRGRARGLRAPRGGVRRRADALPRAPDPAPGHRQPLARAPLRDGLPARGHPPARVRPDRPPGRLQERGLLDVRGADALDLGGVRAADLPRRGRRRPGPGRGAVRARPAAERRRVLGRRPGAAVGPVAGRRRHGGGRELGDRAATGDGAPRAGTDGKSQANAGRWRAAGPSRPARGSRTSTRRSGATTHAGAGRARSTRSATAPSAPGSTSSGKFASELARWLPYRRGSPRSATS